MMFFLSSVTCWAIFCALIVHVDSLPATLKIGVLFTDEQRDSPTELAFKYAVYRINKDQILLANTTLMYDIQYVPKDDSFHAAKKACLLVSSGVSAIFGPQDTLLGSHVQSICDALDIPHIESRVDMEPELKEFSINLHPTPQIIGCAIRDLIHYLNWTKVAIIYEDDLSLISLQELIRPPVPRGLQVVFRKAQQETFRDTLRDIKSRGIFSIVVDTRPHNLPHLLQAVFICGVNPALPGIIIGKTDQLAVRMGVVQYFYAENLSVCPYDVGEVALLGLLQQNLGFLESAPHAVICEGMATVDTILQVQMNDYKYYYHFTTFDLETYNLEDFKHNFVNMTSYRMTDADSPAVIQTLKQMEKFQPVGQYILNKTNVIKVEPALVYDCVYALANGLHSLQRGADLRPANVSCDEEVPWNDGSSLFNYINSIGSTSLASFAYTGESFANVPQYCDVAALLETGKAEFKGLTGPIQFKEGQRSSMKFDLLKLRENNLQKVGEWTTNGRLNITNHNVFHEFGTTNITLKVTTIESTPYVMLKLDRNLTGNERFEGFCIDLLKTIADLIGFSYELYLVPDKKFGAENTTTGEWNGLVREIIDKNADLAMAAMTINYARESVIDFTKPYMNLGIAILFKLPKSMPSRLFSFMSPLAVDIWLYVLAAYALVSSTLFIVARFSPYEWQNPHPCVSDSDVMENQFSLANSFWFTIVTLMHQGCDLNPRATSTRIIGAMWWFFTLIMISSYTANLAAFLTVERMITPIESVEDLAEQNKISYGTLEGGSTMTFFRDSKIETYQKMWRFMENRPSVFVSSYEDGVKRVIEGNYAFLMESTILDYNVQRDCNLTQVGGLLDSKGYGIATPMGSPWRDKISLAILDLQEKGVIQMLYNKWWKKSGVSCAREDKNKEGKANSLGLGNIGGVFVVLLCGLAVAIIAAVVEFFWNSRKHAQTERQSLCSEMAEELRFAVKCRASRQRPALKRQCSKCIPGTTYVPAALEVPQENGIMQMMDMRKSQQVYECTGES